MLWRLFKKLLPYEVALILLFIASYTICRIFNITCLLYSFTKAPCPTCYMARALISLLKGDFKKYIIYNIMALPVAFVFIAELFSIYFGKYKRIIHICSTVILTINMLYYLSRINFVF